MFIVGSFASAAMNSMSIAGVRRAAAAVEVTSLLLLAILSLCQSAVAQSNVPDFGKFSVTQWRVVCADTDAFNPKMQVTVQLQQGYIEPLADNGLARRYAEHVRDRSFAHCNEELKQGKVSSVAKQFVIGIMVPGMVTLPNLESGGSITFSLTPHNGDAFTQVLDTNFSSSIGDYLASVRRQNNQFAQQAAANQAAEAQRQAEIQRKQSFQQSFLAKHSLTGFISPQALKTNPFAVKGKKVAVVTTFERMIGDGEAIFDGIVVRSLPNTMFRDPRWAILAIEVDGMRQIPALGNVSAPVATFLGAYLCASVYCSEVMN